MHKSTLPLAIASAVVAFIVTVVPASGQSGQSQTWIATTGGGTLCSRSAPCNSFAQAQAATAPGGVISVLDSGEFGGLFITKSLTIRAEGVNAGQVSVGGGGFWIVVTAGPSDVVQLEGLHFTGGGIRFDTGGRLLVRHCTIRDNPGTPPASGYGILFQPNSASKLVVTDTAVVNDGTNPAGAGILVKPQAGGSAQVHLERVSAAGGVFGIAADGSGSTAGINMTISDSVASGNSQDGIIAVTPGGGAPIGVYIKNTKSTNNNIGIRSFGPNVTVRVDGSSIIGNGTGLSFGGGGALLTFGNNAVQANGANGAFSGAVALQ